MQIKLPDGSILGFGETGALYASNGLAVELRKHLIDWIRDLDTHGLQSKIPHELYDALDVDDLFNLQSLIYKLKSAYARKLRWKKPRLTVRHLQIPVPRDRLSRRYNIVLSMLSQQLSKEHGKPAYVDIHPLISGPVSHLGQDGLVVLLPEVAPDVLPMVVYIAGLLPPSFLPCCFDLFDVMYWGEIAHAY